MPTAAPIKKLWIGVLIANTKTHNLYLPYFGSEYSKKEAQKKGAKIGLEAMYKVAPNEVWDVVFNDAQEMTREEFEEAIRGYDL